MKPTRNSPDLPPTLAFGAHPDDIEFGFGGVAATETQAKRRVHFIVCSSGESGTNGTPKQRMAEARKSAGLLGATIEFVKLAGDAHLEVCVPHTIRLTEILRRIRPEVVVAPSPVENQHPDHARLGKLVRDAARLARFGGLPELRGQPPHAIKQLFFYAISPEAEPANITPVLIDISAPEIVAMWTAAMRADASQMLTRNYIDFQLTRARLFGARAGVDYAIALFPNEPLVFDSLANVGRGARHSDMDPARDRLRIGITCYPSVGGSGILASGLGEELAERGHEVHFISYEPPFRMKRKSPRIFFHSVVINDYGLFKYPDYTLPLSVKMAEVSRDYQLDARRRRSQPPVFPGLLKGTHCSL